MGHGLEKCRLTIHDYRPDIVVYCCCLFYQVSVETVNQYLGNPECGYLQLLHNINNIEASNDFTVQVEQLKNDMAEVLGKFKTGNMCTSLFMTISVSQTLRDIHTFLCRG